MSRDPLEDPRFSNVMQEAGFHAIPLTDRKGERIAALIRELDDSIKQYDLAYPVIVQEAEQREIKMTEEKLKITVRNELRQRSIRIPETIRWELRAALGG